MITRPNTKKIGVIGFSTLVVFFGGIISLIAGLLADFNFALLTVANVLLSAGSISSIFIINRIIMWIEFQKMMPEQKLTVVRRPEHFIIAAIILLVCANLLYGFLLGTRISIYIH